MDLWFDIEKSFVYTNVQSIFIPSSFQERQARANERNATDFMRFVVMPGMSDDGRFQRFWVKILTFESWDFKMHPFELSQTHPL